MPSVDSTYIFENCFIWQKKRSHTSSDIKTVTHITRHKNGQTYISLQFDDWTGRSSAINENGCMWSELWRAIFEFFRCEKNAVIKWSACWHKKIKLCSRKISERQIFRRLIFSWPYRRCS
jgi:hypothetical protein